MLEKVIKSPLDTNSNATLTRKIAVSQIVNGYKQFGIDISRYFTGISEVGIYQCENTTYRFYYPFNLAGDSKFYEHFQKFDWYYMPWKWEHEITLSYLKDDMKVLEVGCAHGAFLSQISTKFDLLECTGLELNETASKQTESLKIINAFIEDYEKQHSVTYDIVCSYQVLEHISNVNTFLSASIGCLKKGGKLIISVPNNESFIRATDSELNLPPHHMGLWDTQSLRSLEKIFPVKLSAVHYEELQTYHIEGYLFSEYYARYPKKVGVFFYKVANKLGLNKRRFKKIESKRQHILGHTILVVFEKI